MSRCPWHARSHCVVMNLSRFTSLVVVVGCVLGTTVGCGVIATVAMANPAATRAAATEPALAWAALTSNSSHPLMAATPSSGEDLPRTRARGARYQMVWAVPLVVLVGLYGAGQYLTRDLNDDNGELGIREHRANGETTI